MATEKIDIVVSLKDNASKGLKTVNDAFGKLGTTTKLLAASGIAVLAKVLFDCVKAFGESETATKGLESALASTGQEVKNNSKEMQNFASQMQRVTTIEDDAVVAIMKTGVAMGLSAGQAQMYAKQAIGLSEAAGVDLQSAFKMATAAGEGNYMMLQRAIPTLRGIKDETILAAKAQEIIAAGFKQAQDKTMTFEGAMLQMKNAINSAQESIGARLAPAIVWIAGKIKWLADAFVDLDKNWKNIGRTGDALKIIMIEFGRSAVDAVVMALNAFQKFLNILNKIPGVNLNVDGAIKALDELDGRMQDRQIEIAKRNLEDESSEDTKTQMMLDKDAERFALIQEQKLAQQELEKQNQAVIDEGQKAVDAEKHAAFQQQLFAKSNAELQAAGFTSRQITAIRKAQDLEMKKSFDDTMGYLASGMQSKNKEMFAIGKAASIAQAVMSGAQAFNVALASAPPPFNFALAAGVAAMAADKVATINSTQLQLAEGGIVQPQPGGVSATIGEAGSAEAVIPLDSPEARGMMGGGGGTTNVYISGKPLAKEMYEIQQEMIRTGELEA